MVAFFVVRTTMVEDGQTLVSESQPVERLYAEHLARRARAEGEPHGWTVEIVEAAPPPPRGPSEIFPRKIRARFAGCCNECTNGFDAGATIYYAKQTGTYCERCIRRVYARMKNRRDRNQ